ncbi:MAG: hypothetical protein ISQ19_00090 [PS1 clade bacterium]|uniref:Uncharacterized protein n=1 Tax=PS1 clade bacterium TaxID=2175152 RepID=A0A937HLR8_9PROT|nr:hypothetical protein [PS1 clade bacterium]
MRKTAKEKGKKFPDFKSDKEAEHFVDTADLSEYDFSDFRPMSEVLADVELEQKDMQVNIRMPTTLYGALKATAKTRKIPYQRLVRKLLADGLQSMDSKK